MFIDLSSTAMSVRALSLISRCKEIFKVDFVKSLEYQNSCIKYVAILLILLYIPVINLGKPRFRKALIFAEGCFCLQYL